MEKQLSGSSINWTARSRVKSGPSSCKHFSQIKDQKRGDDGKASWTTPHRQAEG
jgi:hypothetical protein